MASSHLPPRGVLAFHDVFYRAFLLRVKLLTIGKPGFVPPRSQTGAKRLSEIFSQRYERPTTLVTNNLPFDEWTHYL